jgi:hypothetical protein
VPLVEGRIEAREVGARVGSAGLFAEQSSGRDEPGERVGVVEQGLQAGGVALEAGVAPHRLARRSRGRGGDGFGRGGIRRARALGALQRVQGGAAAEDEALGQ